MIKRLFPPLSSQLKVQLLKKMPIKYKARDENLDRSRALRSLLVMMIMTMATAKLVMGSNRYKYSNDLKILKGANRG